MKKKDEMANKQELINRERKFSEPQEEEDHHNDNDVQLTLSPPPSPPPEKQPPPRLQEEEDHHSDNDLQPPPEKQPQPQPPLQEEEDHHNDNDVQLTLSPPPSPPPEKQPPPLLQEEEDHHSDNDEKQPQPQPPFQEEEEEDGEIDVHKLPPHVIYITSSGLEPAWSLTPLSAVPLPAHGRQKKIKTVKSETIPAPFPWATTRRATVQSLADLESQQILTITGAIQCKNCDNRYQVQYDLKEKFNEVSDFIVKNKDTMLDRAPKEWLRLVLPMCMPCLKQGNRSSMKPVIAEKKREINWVFLLLGQMIGCCTLPQLKYFCKHTKNHRTGSKDRLLYLTYLGLCKQLEPNGPF